MSDGIKRMYEDMDDWDSLKEQANIKNCKWDVYSTEASYARTGFRSKNLTGEKLLKFVQKCLDRDEAKRKKQEIREEIKLYKKLKKKYEGL